MQTITINNGAFQPPTVITLKGIRERSGTTNIRNLNTSHKRQRIFEARENTLSDFARVLGAEKMRERANKQREERRSKRK